MTVEYYVKRKLKGGQYRHVRTCKTPEEARRDMQLLNDRKETDCVYGVFYSEDAIVRYQETHPMVKP
jgi:hypothetical protein